MMSPTKRMFRAALALAGILGLYSACALLLAPWAEPPADAGEFDPSAVLAPASAAPREELLDLFPEDSWIRQDAKMVETEDGLLLFKEYATTEDGRLQISPLTVIYRGDAGTGSSRPIVMEAPEGAKIQFDRPLDLRSAKIGKLIGGRLEGEVRIYQPAEHGVGNSLEILTRNVQIDRQRIWTPHEVAFRHEGHFGRGKDLLIALKRSGKGNGDEGSVGGIRSVELVHVDKFHFEVDREPGPLRQPPLEITCRGPFLLDFDRNLSTFEDQVDIVRLHPNGASDQLNCQRLEIHLMPRGGVKKPPKSPAVAENVAATNAEKPPAESESNSLQVKKIVAIGHPVTLRVPSFGGTARGRRLEYDFQTRRIHLEDDSPVMLNYGPHSIEALDVLYEMPTVPFEKQLPGEADWGRLWAKGPGNIRSRTEEGQELLVTWGEQLVMQPQAGEQVVSLLGSARVLSPEWGEISAGTLHLWLTETPQPAEGAPPRRAGNSFASRFQPNRLLAQKSVNVNSPQFTGLTGELKVWFIEAPLVNNPPRERDPWQPERPPEPPRETRPQTAANNSRYHLEGATVQIELLRRGEETSVNAVTINGDVRLVESLVAEPGAAPFEIRGDALQMNNVSASGGVVQIVGRPARVAARGMELASGNVQLDRRRNRIWVDGPGEITMPLTQVGGPPAAPGVITPPAQRGSVHWRNSLDFDGSTFHFERGVTLRTEAQAAFCETLDVALAAPLDLSATRFGQPQVATILLGGETRIENRTLEPNTGRLLALDRMLTRDVQIHAQSGDLRAAGAGWLRSTRLQNGGSGLGGIGSLGGSPQPPAGQPAGPSLMHLYVQFDQGITGNLRRREVTLHQGVQAILGPVQQWEEELPLADPNQLPTNAVTLACNQLSVVDMSSNGQALEVVAAGNTVIEAKTFTARATRLSYAQAKQLLVLEGDGRTNAELWRQTRVGGPSSHAAARKILYWHGTNQIEVEDAQVFDFTEQLGAGGPLPRFIDPRTRTATRPR